MSLWDESCKACVDAAKRPTGGEQEQRPEPAASARTAAPPDSPVNPNRKRGAGKWLLMVATGLAVVVGLVLAAPDVFAPQTVSDPLLWLIAAVAASAILHIYTSTMLLIIARKTVTRNAWLAWFPLFNLVLICRIARRSMLWFWMLLIPCVSPLAVIVLAAGMARQRGVSAWTGVLSVVPGLNLLWLTWLAWRPAPAFVLRSSWREIPLCRKTRLTTRELPTLWPMAGSAIVAEVSPDPQDPLVLGLKNHSTISWSMTAGGRSRSVAPGQTVPLKPSVDVRLGIEQASIEPGPVATPWPRRFGGAALAAVGGCLIVSAVSCGFSWHDAAGTPPDLPPFGPEEEAQWEADLLNKSFHELGS